MQRPHIRRAQPDDAGSLAGLAERTFRDTFSTDNAAADMEAYVREALSTQTVRDEIADGANTFLLAFLSDGDEPTGYAKLRRERPNPSVSGPDPIELQRLYVDQAAIGHGVGAALMQASLDAVASSGHRTLWLGVWEKNPRAIAFYERWGFEIVGSHVFRLGEDDQTDLILERSVPG